jgi:hypothetical protein
VTSPVSPTIAATVGAVVSGIAGGAGNVSAAAKSDASNTLAGLIPGAGLAGDITDEALAIRAWITDRHNWTRVGWFLAGAVMFTVGAVMLGERPIAAAANTVAAPVGRVVKSAH